MGAKCSTCRLCFKRCERPGSGSEGNARFTPAQEMMLECN
jgi:hypothetical protein